MNMKKLFLLFSLCLSLPAVAQDVIVMKDGSTILSKVLEVNPGDVKYKKFSNQGGPTYTINKTDIMCINYENGERDSFEVRASQTGMENSEGNGNSPVYIEKKPAENNQALINQYNKDIHFVKTATDKNANHFFPILGISESSLMSNDEFEMSFVPTIILDRSINGWRVWYRIALTNKTDKILYVDRGNSFRIYNDNSYKTYYSPEQTAIVNSKGKNATLGLGGVADVLGIGGVAGTLANSTSIGGSSQNASVTTFTQERIIAIPPKGTASLSVFKEVWDGNNYRTISELEYWRFNAYIPNLKKNGALYFNEDNSPYKNKYIITYSNSADFSSYSTLQATVYTRCFVGNRYTRMFENSIIDIISNWRDNMLIGYWREQLYSENPDQFVIKEIY